MALTEEQNKECTACGDTKSLGEFYNDSRSTDGRQSRCKDCYGQYWKKDRESNTDKYRLKSQERFLRYRLAVIDAYGSKCTCCGEEQWQFLSIDHIAGGGTRHRKEMGISGGTAFYKWLIDNNFPEGFQILCFNCNCAKKHRELCPHQDGKAKMTLKQEHHLLTVKKRISGNITKKYKVGQRTHGGNLFDMPAQALLANALDEVADLAVYLITLQDQLENLRCPDCGKDIVLGDIDEV